MKTRMALLTVLGVFKNCVILAKMRKSLCLLHFHALITQPITILFIHVVRGRYTNGHELFFINIPVFHHRAGEPASTAVSSSVEVI